MRLSGRPTVYISFLRARQSKIRFDPARIKAQLTAAAEFSVWDAVEVVVAEAELEDARLLQLDGHVGHRNAVADHGPVFSG